MAFSLPPVRMVAVCDRWRRASRLGGAGATVGQRALAGLLAGAGQLIVGLAWADKFTLLGYMALVLVQSAMFALACGLAQEGTRPGPGLRRLADARRVGTR